MQTVTGQCLDMTTAPPEGKIDFTLFTMETYSAIVQWKTAYYSFYLPVALAMYMVRFGCLKEVFFQPSVGIIRATQTAMHKSYFVNRSTRPTRN